MAKHVIINYLGPKMLALEPWEFCFEVKSRIILQFLQSMECGVLKMIIQVLNLDPGGGGTPL